MIGVAAKESERDIVKEFFELLKTPWEFYRTGRQYDVVLCTSEDYDCEAGQLLLVFSNEPVAFDAEAKVHLNSKPNGFVSAPDGTRLPIYGGLATFPGQPNSFLTEETTSEPAAFASQRANVTALRIGYNLFDEVRFLLTDGQPAANASIPTLDEHIARLREWITLAGIPLVEIPPIPSGYNFIACLTHDIDHPALRNHWCDHTMFGFFYRSTVGTWLNVYRGKKSARVLWENWRAACLLPLVHLRVVKDFWQDFDRYLNLEAGYRSTFFVIPRGNYAGRTIGALASAKRACRYELRDVLPQLRKIISADCEVAVHGLDAWLDADAGFLERQQVAQAVGSSELGVRMHWLFFDRNSPALLDRAGFTYDATVGYGETIGYRAGTTQVFRPPGATKLMELPLHVMDTSLFYPSYLNLDEKQAQVLVWRLIDNVERLGGAVTINWHDRSIAPERLWDLFYLKLLEELRDRGAWFPTASHAVAWFRKRRKATLKSEPAQGNRIRVRGYLSVGDTLPDLRIRIHKPRGRSLCEPRLGTPPQFVDAPFENGMELSVAI